MGTVTITINKPGGDLRQNWYFTFGFGQPNAGRYFLVENATWHEARARMVELFGTVWAFQYDELEWWRDGISQADKYGLERLVPPDETAEEKNEPGGEGVSEPECNVEAQEPHRTDQGHAGGSERSDSGSLTPLDAAGVLWVAALDLVPIGERVLWVNEMTERVESINAMRAASSPDRPTSTNAERSSPESASGGVAGGHSQTIRALIDTWYVTRKADGTYPPHEEWRRAVAALVALEARNEQAQRDEANLRSECATAWRELAKAQAVLDIGGNALYSKWQAAEAELVRVTAERDEARMEWPASVRHFRQRSLAAEARLARLTSRAVYIARCPEHGLHGDRETCFVCGGPVEQVAMAELEAEAKGAVAEIKTGETECFTGSGAYCKRNPRRAPGEAWTGPICVCGPLECWVAGRELP